jgi:hypothetical protein
MANEPKKAPESTPQDKLAALESAASFKALVESCAKDLGNIKDGWALVLDAIKSIDDKVKLQEAAVAAAKDFAAQNGLQSSATVLGHEPLVAHSMLNMSELAWPAVLRPMFYVCQFPDKESLWMNIQLTLNQGQPLLVLGGHQNSEQIARALLNGMRPNEVQSSPPEAIAKKSEASNWFGFRPPSATKAA